MALVKRVEDLEVWKKGCRLSCEIFRMSDRGTLARKSAIRDQMCRSALSIPSNIAEGFERDSRKAFANFVRIAKGSCGELRTQLYIAAKLDYIEPRKAAALVAEAKSISGMLARLAARLDLRA